MQRSNKPGLIRLFWWVIVLSCTSAGIWLAGSNPLLLLAAMFIHGVVMVHHFALQHECSHFTAFRSRKLCLWLARTCGFLLMIPPLFFRYEHCDHHTYTNQRGRDPEMIELPASTWQYIVYLSAMPYWSSQFSGLLRRAAGRFNADEKRFIPKIERRAVILESRLMIIGYSLIVLSMLLWHWSAPLIFWWLPLLMAEPVMRFIRMTEHVGRPAVADLSVNTRTNLVSWPWRFLAWEMNYHAEHHYAASVPFYALSTLHDKLRGHVFVEPCGYLCAHAEIIKQISASRIVNGKEGQN